MKMKEHYQDLMNHPRIARGWTVWYVCPSANLKFINGVLHQECSVEWTHEREQHIGGGYYSNQEKTTEWLKVPEIKQ